MAHLTSRVAQHFEMIRAHEQNKVVAGFHVGDPTTPSAQLTGTGNTTWSYDNTGGTVIVDGDVAELDAAADATIHSGSYLTGFANGSSCIAALVAKNVSGTVTLAVVKGTPATTGSQVAPTDAEIQAAVGAGNAWVKLAECTLNRTADTTVTETHDCSARPILGLNVDPTFGDW
jgi:hypothetical protein